jgi:hypothetical protein
MVYEHLEVRAALIAGLQSDDSRRDIGDAVGISTGFPKGRGKVGKPASCLSVLSIPLYLHNLFLAKLFFFALAVSPRSTCCEGGEPKFDKRAKVILLLCSY